MRTCSTPSPSSRLRGTFLLLDTFNFDIFGKLSRVSSAKHCGGPAKGEGTQRRHLTLEMGRGPKKPCSFAARGPKNPRGGLARRSLGLVSPHSTGVVECGLSVASPRSGAWAALWCKAPGDALLLGEPEPDRGPKVPEIRSVGCSQV